MGRLGLVRAIARTEFLMILRDGRFRWTAAMMAVLLFVSLGLGWQQSREIQTERDHARQVDRDQWLAQGDKYPHAAAHYGTYAFKPVMPLAFIDRGIDAYVGVAVWLEAHKQNEFRYRPARDATTAQRFGELTPSTVLQVLMPLLIIFLSFAAFSSERESGTLRQVLSLGVHPHVLALGKLFGVAAALAVVLVPVVVIGVAMALTMSDVSSLGMTMPRLLCLWLAYLIYAGTFFTVSLAVSAWASSSRLSLVMLLGFWITSALIVPRAVADLLQYLYPTPSTYEFGQQIQHAMANTLAGHNRHPEALAALKARTLKQFGVDRIEDLPVSFDGIQLQEGEEHGYVIFDRLYAELWSVIDRQNGFAHLGALLSPTMAIRFLSMGLAGTDFDHHRDFATTAERHRRTMIRIINDDIIHHSKTGDRGYTAGANLWERVPPFQYRQPSTLSVLSRQRWNIAGLAAWLALGAAALFLAVRRIGM